MFDLNGSKNHFQARHEVEIANSFELVAIIAYRSTSFKVEMTISMSTITLDLDDEEGNS